MNIRDFTIFSVISTAFLVTLLFVTAYQSRAVQSEVAEKERQRFNSLKLANELFQSSEDLTRMARAYVITGNPVYKDYFHQILAIRNGQLPRPYDDSLTYWHLEGIGKAPAGTSGETIPLIDLMRREGLSEKELELLRESQLNSDRLVALERQAFAAVEGWFDNGHGEYTVPGKPDRAFAQTLLWGEEYVNEKSRIMRPLQQVWRLLDERTQAELNTAQVKLEKQRAVEVVILALILSGLVAAVLYIRWHILQPLKILTKETEAIAGGVYSARCDTAGTNEIARLGADFNRMAAAIEQVITRHEQAEEMLQHSETRLKEAQQIAQIGNWELDLVGGRLYWSDEIFRIFEINQEKFGASYEFFLHAIHPEDREKVDHAYTASLLSHTSYEITHRLLMPDGRIKWVNERCRTYYDDHGKPLRSAGTVQDVTDRMQAEETINLYATVFQRSGEAIVITDADRKILAVNDAFCKQTGYSREAVLGQNPRIWSSAETSTEQYRALWKGLNEKNFWQGEITNRHKEGHNYVAWLSISAIRNAQNKVTHYVASFSDITEHKAAANKIYYLAHHDTLTDLPNRFTLIERLKQAINSARRNNEKVGVLFIDLDRFKIINDTLGHHIGDLLLVEVAQRLKACTRSNDIVARLGGDEFVTASIGLENIEAIFPIADKILRVLGQPYSLDKYEIHSSPSIGIAFFPDDGMSAEEVMKNSDVAMYHAKSKGRNNYQFFEASMNQANLERLQLEHDMRAALEREEFVLHYQPKINTHTLRVIGVEALIRWRHPEKGLIFPATFIPMAEESGLMLPLGEWALNTACRQLKQWQNAGMTDLQISVNLSQRQFYRQNFASLVASIVARENIDPTLLELEITESMAMGDPQKTIENLHILRNIGVKLALDDFGTGYSSLSYLKQFPINCLKLDRSYVKDIETDPSDAAICAATISLAHDLGLDVVAEGVETEKQYEYLKMLGCDKIQGYFFCKPIPVDEVEAFIRAHNSNALYPLASVNPLTILVIDDDEWVCDFHQHILENMGYKPVIQLDPVKGLQMIRNHPDYFRLILLDMLMPNMSSVDLIKAIREINFTVPIVVITSSKPDAVHKALRPLEKDYNLSFDVNYFVLEKPLTAEHLRDLIHKILETEVSEFQIL